MSFTALHRALGLAPGPWTEDLLDAAVAAGVTESDDLDWKTNLPPAKGLPQTDFPKDVAAMANSGGGVIIYGVCESQKAATGRMDVGELTEVYERTLRSAAITAISPPVFGLNIHRLGATGNRAVVVEIPSSVDGPHLIYRGDYFGAPLRSDADTVWMKERQIEAMYRARFEERRHATEALDALHTDVSTGRDTQERAWLMGVAHPRVPRHPERLTRESARAVLNRTERLALKYASQRGMHPLQNVDTPNPRPGLRRWVCVNTATSERSRWKEAWLSIHHDGSVTLAAVVGGHPAPDVGGGHYADHQIESYAIECAVADLMALLRATAEATGNDEYDLRIGIEWAGSEPLTILAKDQMGYTYADNSIPLHRFAPVSTTVNAREPDLDYFWHVHDLAQDCVNQGGVSYVHLICLPERDT
ncbi:AlbA family DNA-binding domain-containing protein [Streptomyces sp. NPDC055085]